MQKTKIPWCDYTINPVKGRCPNPTCPLGEKCYARRMYKRFGWNPEIRFDPTVFMTLPTKPSRIFVGSTMELFGGWNLWMDEIISLCRRIPEHTFIFLTKKPESLIKWSPFPDNCWVGVSATDTPSYQDACLGLNEVEAKVRFISFEPLLGAIYTQILNPMTPYYNRKHNGIPFDWVIVGCQTPVSPKSLCRFEWVEEIVNAVDHAKIPVFIKKPLSDLMNLHRTEYPEFERVGSNG